MTSINKNITHEVLKKAIANEVDVDELEIVIEKFDVSDGSNKYDNYACEIKAVEVCAKISKDSSMKNFSYMIKCMPDDEERKKIFQNTKVFEIEAQMYQRIIPALKAIENEFNFDERIQTVRCFFASSDHGVIVMENLKKKNYFITDKTVGFNMEQIKKTLKQLAFLHSTSYHFIKTYKGGLEKFKKDFKLFTRKGMFQDDDEFGEKLYEGMLTNQDNLFADIIKEHCSDDEELVKKINDFKLVRKEILDDFVQVKEENFNCILHGDSWCNNFLLKNNLDGNVENVKILDLQVSRRANAIFDIIYLFYSSITPEFKNQHYNELLNYYHLHLSQRLKVFGYQDIFPLETIQSEYKKKIIYGFIIARSFSMILLTPRDSDEGQLNLEEIKNDDESMKEFHEKFYQGQIRLVRKNEPLRKRIITVAKEALPYL